MKPWIYLTATIAFFIMFALSWDPVYIVLGLISNLGGQVAVGVDAILNEIKGYKSQQEES